jgi:hypothetical protein
MQDSCVLHAFAALPQRPLNRSGLYAVKRNIFDPAGKCFRRPGRGLMTVPTELFPLYYAVKQEISVHEKEYGCGPPFTYLPPPVFCEGCVSFGLRGMT